MDKLSQVILYILQKKTEGYSRLDIAKLIYYSDGVHFQKHAKIISGQLFIHMEDTPLPVDLDKTIMKMKKEGLIDVKPEIHDGNLKGFLIFSTGKETVSMIKEERRIIKKVLEAFKRGVYDESKQYPNLYENYVITALYSQIPFSVDTLNTKIHFFKKKSLLELSGKIFRIFFN